MQSDAQPATVSKPVLWAGWIITVLVAAALIMSGVMKLLKPQDVVDGFTHLGWPVDYALGLGILEIACVVIYVFPRTAVLGAILLTGYLGGAIATHVRIGEQFIPPAVLGVLAWGGLYLRDIRLRDLIPLRS